MLKLLFVTSGDDFAADTFQSMDLNLIEVYDACRANGGRIVFGETENLNIKIDEGKDISELDGIEVEAHIFEDIDPNFLKFVSENIQDYDDSKHRGFFCIDDNIYR